MYALVKEAYRDLKSQIFILSAKQWQNRITENLITHVREPFKNVLADFVS